MNEQTISSNRYPLAGMFNGTVIALWGAFFLMLLLRGLPRFKNGLLDMDAHAFHYPRFFKD